MKQTIINIPADIHDSLHQILDYLWEDAKEDYESRGSEDEDGHVFEALLNVRKWLTLIKPEKQ